MLDAFVGEVRDGVGRFGWAKVAGAVRPSTIVVANVLGEVLVERIGRYARWHNLTASTERLQDRPCILSKE